MAHNKDPQCYNEDDCEKLEMLIDDVKGFKRLVIAIQSVQAVFVIAALSMCVQSMARLSSTVERQVQIVERQKNIEKKADVAGKQSAEALTLSGRAEANIQWIREGLTEVKMQLRHLTGKSATP